jgi:pimeloyl-ACP methyl ester carboxylesterase
MKTSSHERSGRVRLAYLAMVVAILVSVVGTAAASPRISQDNCVTGLQPSGAVYLICMPPEGQWNGDLVVYAHGYVAPNEPVGIPENQLFLPDGTPIPELINNLGYAFAATSYRANGLVIVDGIDDLVELVGLFGANVAQPGRVYLTGVSEGGLTTALATEQHPDVFDGGLATCGPVGDFQRQINYFGDARVLFDYFFPGVIPGSPVDIPQEVMDNWDNLYAPAVVAALAADPGATEQLLNTANVPINQQDPAVNIEALVGVLWYNVFATNNARQVLGGQPFDNARRIYLGSNNDRRLNRLVARFTADPAAAAQIAAYYQTSGDLTVPTNTLHTVKDPTVPYWHETLFNLKVLAHHDLSLHVNFPALAYGHCNFTPRQVLVAFGVLVLQVTGSEPARLDQVLQQVGE